MKIIDAHCHLYSFDETYIRDLRNYLIIAVSEDLISAKTVLKLSEAYEFIIPAVGYHPWKISTSLTKREKDEIYKIINRYDLKVLGEIGLDKKFVPKTFEKQLETFEFFLKIAKEFDLSLNLHAPNAWHEILNLVIKNDINRVYFHWYTGPLDLIPVIESYGYFIGINPAFKIQKKHEDVLKNVSINNLLIESDGPYKYRNMMLEPKVLTQVIDEICEIKNVSKEFLIKRLNKNLNIYLNV